MPHLSSAKVNVCELDGHGGQGFLKVRGQEKFVGQIFASVLLQYQYMQCFDWTISKAA